MFFSYAWFLRYLSAFAFAFALHDGVIIIIIIITCTVEPINPLVATYLSTYANKTEEHPLTNPPSGVHETFLFFFFPCEKGKKRKCKGGMH